MKIKRRVKAVLRKQSLTGKEDLYIRALKGVDEMTYSELNTRIIEALKTQK